jgi:hypothetical protein
MPTWLELNFIILKNNIYYLYLFWEIIKFQLFIHIKWLYLILVFSASFQFWHGRARTQWCPFGLSRMASHGSRTLLWKVIIYIF